MKSKKHKSEIPRAYNYNRAETPSVIQMEAVECGAACLSAILEYYGKYVSLEELRASTGVTRDGVSVYGIMVAGQSNGLFVEAHSVTLDKLYELPLPSILFWNFEHFVVLEGYSREEVYLMDPAVGHVSITYDDLNRSFTGIVLIFEKGDTFIESGRKRSVVENIKDIYKKARLPFLYAFLAGLSIVIPQLAVPVLSQIFVDNFLINKIFNWKNEYIFGAIVIIALTFLLKLLEARMLARLHIYLSTILSGEFLWHILRLPYTFYLQRYSGEIANRMQINESVANNVSTYLSSLLTNAIVAILFAVTMLYYDVWVAGFGITMVLIDLYLVYYLNLKRANAYNYYQQTYGRSVSYEIGILKNIETIKATSIEFNLFSQWAGFFTKNLNSMQSISKWDVWAGTIPPFLQMLTNISVLAFGAYRVIEGDLTVGMLLALIILMNFFMEPMTKLINFNSLIQTLQIDISRLNDVLNNPLDKSLIESEERESENKKNLPISKLKGSLKLENVVFGFDKFEAPILKNISFEVKPGTMVGIVGTTGSGKSTIIKLISGLIDVWSGSIYFDDVKKDDIPRNLKINSIGVVEQDSYLFSATVKDNITLFNPLIQQQQILQGAKDASIHDEIIKRKGGYDLYLNNNASNLSGGQRQRVEIARVLAKDPSILLLDEATAALDTEAEAAIMENIRKRGCTCLIVAHRLSSLKYCDEIIVLDKGIIVEKGLHNDLMSHEGYYKSLVDAEKTIQSHMIGIE